MTQVTDATIEWMKDQGAVGEHRSDVELDFWCNVMDGATQSFNDFDDDFDDDFG